MTFTGYAPQTAVPDPASGHNHGGAMTPGPLPSGVDDTANLQTAVTDLAAAGGGTVQLAFARYQVGGNLTIPSNVVVVGAVRGPFDPNSDPSQTTFATTFLMTTTSSAVSFTGRNSGLEDIIFHYPNQIAVTSGSNPTVYPATFSTVAGSAGIRCRRIALTNAYQGFNLLGGRHIVDDIWAGCLSNVFTVDNSLDRIHIRRVVANPFWNTVAGKTYPQTIDTWVAANKVVGIIYRADALVLENIFGFSGNVGLQMLDTLIGGLSPAPSYGDGANVRFDTFTTGIQCKSTQSPGWQFSNFAANSSSFNIMMLNGGGTVPKLRVRGGVFWGATTVSNTAGGLDIDGVENFNPQGSQTPPGMPSSGSVLANPFPSRMMVIITAPAGVTVSAVGVGPSQPATGVTVAASTTGPPIILAANEGIKLTYTGGTPTWTWFGI